MTLLASDHVPAGAVMSGDMTPSAAGDWLLAVGILGALIALIWWAITTFVA